MQNHRCMNYKLQWMKVHNRASAVQINSLSHTWLAVCLSFLLLLAKRRGKQGHMRAIKKTPWQCEWQSGWNREMDLRSHGKKVNSRPYFFCHVSLAEEKLMFKIALKKAMAWKKSHGATILININISPGNNIANYLTRIVNISDVISDLKEKNTDFILPPT
jgi:hypothetical protein